MFGMANFTDDESNSSIKEEIEEVLDTLDSQELDESGKERLTQAVFTYLKQKDREKLEERLRILYEYQEKYLDLVQEYKEEIKFVNTIQEDLRRERAQFFSQTLKEVSSTLEQAQIGDEVAEEWIRELVGSYTSSLDVGRDLAKSRVSNMVGKLRKRTESEADSVESDESQ
jgi:phospholipid N-methyltransferase